MTENIKISKAKVNDLQTVIGLYRNARLNMDRLGIHQWTSEYPRSDQALKDLQSGCLYKLTKDAQSLAVISINEDQDPAYQHIDWQFDDSKVLVIHRLVVHPNYEGQGHAQSLMDFAENYALGKNYTSIRLDAYSANPRSQNFYLKRAYHIRGELFFPGRKEAFYAMEKTLLS